MTPAIDPHSPPSHLSSYSTMDITREVSEVLERGYCVLPSFLTPQQCQEVRDVHDQLVAAGVGRDLGDNGILIHPLLPTDARLSWLFSQPRIIAICAQALGSEVVLKHTGSRIDRAGVPGSLTRCGWHNHAFTPELNAIKSGDVRRGSRPTRLLTLFYPDGSSPEIGPLVVLPRRWDDPLAPPPGVEIMEAWPGEVVVEAPPGSAVIFTTDLWHSGMIGNRQRCRRLTGAHIQARSCAQTHPEDHVFDTPSLTAACRELPLLAELLGSGAHPILSGRWGA